MADPQPVRHTRGGVRHTAAAHYRRTAPACVVNLLDATASCRTLLVEGPAGPGRDAVLAELSDAGFTVLRPPRELDRLDPARSYRELLDTPGRIALDGGPLRELVYGPLRRGRARVTWIEALDFADAVAERDGALVHVPGADPAEGASSGEEAAAQHAYERAATTLAQHLPLVTVASGECAAQDGRTALSTPG
ncbi:hypothetical protein [Streptomyces sp. NPDC050560]|uniref:hypothetical protein n=1 Tax=Streptomyces sp. NPDC050560 TaxID=3365630 RepID=UPI0037ACB797